MNVEDRNTLCEEFFHSCVELLRKKGKDYNGTENGFSALENLSDTTGISVEKILFLLMSKHYNSIAHYFKSGKLESEPLENRFRDLANFSALLYVRFYQLNEFTDGEQVNFAINLTLWKKLEIIKERFSNPLIQNVVEELEKLKNERESDYAEAATETENV